MEESIRSQLWTSQLLQYERETRVEPHARLLKVVIEGIEAQQKDLFYHVRSVPDICMLLSFLPYGRTCDGRELARQSAYVDAVALYRVMKRVEREDKILLREVLVWNLRSYRGAYLRADVIEWKLLIRDLDRSVELVPNSVSASQPGSQLALAFNAAVAAVLHLLAFVFQYLIGYVDRGGSKTFSSGAFDFRATFVSLVLFQGAYIWIKFRQAAPPSCRKRKAPAPDTTTDLQLADGCYRKGVCRRVQSTGTIKYEARFRPPKEKVDGGTNIRPERLDLGEYHTCVEAMIVLQIARCYYDDSKDEGCLELQDGPYKFSIPPMSEQERDLTGEEKRKWVKRTAKQVGKQVYADFQREKGKPKSDMAVDARFHAGHGNGAGSSGLSSSVLPLTRSSPAMLTTIADDAIVPNALSYLSLALLPYEDAFVGDADDFSGATVDDDGMIAELLGEPDLACLPSSLVSYQPFSPIFGDSSLSGVEAVTRKIEHVSETELSPGFNLQQGRVLVDSGSQNTDESVFLQQGVPVLQQVVHYQKEKLADSDVQVNDMEHRLKTSQFQISELQKEIVRLKQEKQQEKEVFEQEREQWLQENESLKSRLQQVAKSQVAAWTGIMIDIQPKD